MVLFAFLLSIYSKDMVFELYFTFPSFNRSFDFLFVRKGMELALILRHTALCMLYYP